MDLEEHTLETVGDHCEECGAKLTRDELQAAMETGGPSLCKIHAAEAEPALEVDELELEE
jgi:methionyl-tRNA synthetase